MELDGELMSSLIAALVANEVTVDPTLVLMESLYFGDDPKVLERLEPQRAPPLVVSLWGPDWRQRNPFVFTNPVGVALKLQKWIAGGLSQGVRSCAKGARLQPTRPGTAKGG